jgi:hypothetical protein
MAEWFSIEVFDGSTSARAWQESFGDRLVTAGHGEGMTNWSWHTFRWGVILEVELPDELAWERFRQHPAVGAALDAVPDPISGLIMYRGRGGSSGDRRPRRPRPFAGAGAMSVPEPVEYERPEPARLLTVG